MRLGGGRFIAGDLAEWKDGELVLRGRVDDLVNIKGKKVNPREVEAVLAQLPGVREVAVLGVLRRTARARCCAPWWPAPPAA